MNRKRMVMGWIGALSMALVLSACKSAPPPAPEAPPPPPPPAPMEVKPEPEPMMEDKTMDPLAGDLMSAMTYAYEMGMLGDVYFDFDKYDLRPDARERLAKNAQFMRANPQFRFEIQGHCDERGTNEYNLALGDRRANAALGYLASLGVGASGYRTISYGEEKPQCTVSDESCWQLNRRAHFVITGRSGG